MISEGQILSFRNVVSKIYKVYSNEFDLAMDDMSELMEKYSLHANGPFFYSIISDFLNDPLIIEIFVPVKESSIVNLEENELEFKSYFLVDSLLMMRVDNEFEKRTVEAQMKMINYVEKNNMGIHSPFFTMLKEVENKLYIEVYLKALYKQ